MYFYNCITQTTLLDKQIPTRSPAGAQQISLMPLAALCVLNNLPSWSMEANENIFLGKMLFVSMYRKKNHSKKNYVNKREKTKESKWYEKSKPSEKNPGTTHMTPQLFGKPISFVSEFFTFYVFLFIFPCTNRKIKHTHTYIYIYILYIYIYINSHTAENTNPKTA